jgi:alpha-L-rhamnosidase
VATFETGALQPSDWRGDWIGADSQRGSAPWLGSPRLRLKLEVDYTDGSHGTVVSDTDWQVSSGPTTRDSVYLGETYNARLAQPGWDRPGFDASNWHLAAEVTAPTPNLRSQRMEPIRVVDTLRAARVTSPKPGTYVFKYPVVTAGWARLRVTGAAGTEVTLRYGETLLADGTVDNPATRA